MVPNGWKKLPLSELTKEKISYGIVQAGPHVEDGVPYIKSSDVGGEIDILKLQKTAPEIHHKYRRSAVHPNDIVFSLRGNIARTSIVPTELPEANLTQGTARISVNNQNDTKFIYYQLASPEVINSINALSKGSTFKEISLEELRKVTLIRPPLQEQQKIAKILSTWDKAIATTEKLIDASQQQKKALMQQLLTGKKRLVNPDTGKVFEGDWEEVRVANFGKVVTGNTPPKGDDSNYGSDISWATAEDFKGKYVGNTKVKLTKSGVSKARLVPKGSVLVTCIASIGKNAIADEDLTTNQQINAVIVNSKHCNEFFYYQIEFNKHKLLAWAGTTAVPILNKSSFEKILLLAPLKHEQQKIASVLTAADKEIELLETKLAHLKNEKKALMQQLLTGKRRVKVEAMEMA